MEKLQIFDDIWIIFSVKDELYALPSRDVKEMISLSGSSQVPNMPPHIRGIVNLRDRVFPLLDLRKLFDFQSLREETDVLVKELHQRELDHRNWIQELENSIKEKREFKLTTDPHKCAFGRWYDVFRTDNLILNATLRKMNDPHQAIHALGVQARKLFDDGHSSDALKLIEETRGTTLTNLLELFQKLYRQLTDDQREIGIIVNHEQDFIISVDSVVAVEKLNTESIVPAESVDPSHQQRVVQYLGRRRTGDRVVMLLTGARIFEISGGMPKLEQKK